MKGSVALFMAACFAASFVITGATIITLNDRIDRLERRIEILERTP